MAVIFSVYNLSRQQDAYKRTMDEDDLKELCRLLKVPYDDTVIVIFKRGVVFNISPSELEFDVSPTKLRNNSIFK